ncbi:MAG: hypothetical protein GY899_12920 [Verrucomicrobiaceae bacterium]|nr:hypothetical protein [Verrucomicrobiaceae bacterium]
MMLPLSASPKTWLLIALFPLTLLSCSEHNSSTTGKQEEAAGLPGKTVVYARLESIADIPDPALTPYPDCLVTGKFRKLDIQRGKLEGEVFLATFWAFRNREKTGVDNLSPGDAITMSLRPMEKVKGMQSYMRLDETDDFISPSYFTDYWQSTSQGKVTRQVDPKEEQAVSFTTEETHSIPNINQALIRQSDECISGKDGMFFFQFSREIYRPKFWQIPPGTRFANGSVGALGAIEHFHDQLQNHNIPLLIVITPRSSSIFPGLATGMPFSPATDKDVNFPVTNLVKHLNSRGIHTLNLTPAFMENRWEKRGSEKFPVTLPHEDHWSGFGAKIAAMETFRKIKSIGAINSRLQGSDDPFSEIVQTEELLQVGAAFARFFPDEPDRIPPRKTIIHRLKGISEAEKSYDINRYAKRGIMIGDSYLRMYAKNQASYPQHLKNLLRQDLQVIAPSGGITSSRQVLARTVKPEEISFIIWELAEDFLPLHQLWREVPLGAPRTMISAREQFNLADNNGNGWIINSGTLSGTRQSSLIHEAPQAGEAVAITWKTCSFGKESSFITSLITGPTPLPENKQRTTVTFQVIVNDTIIASKNMKTKHQSPSIIENWQIPLEKFRGKTGAFTLSCQVNGKAKPQFISFRNPVLLDANFK